MKMMNASAKKKKTHMGKQCIARTQTTSFETTSLAKPYSPSGVLTVQKDFSRKALCSLRKLHHFRNDICIYFLNERKQETKS